MKGKKNRLFFIRKKQRKEERRRKRHKTWKKSVRGVRKVIAVPKHLASNIIAARKHRRPENLMAPRNFSLINNPSDVLNFLSEMRHYLKMGASVIVNFNNTEVITPDALALLIAKTNDPKFHNNIPIHGLRPPNKELDKMFLESGFYKAVGISKEIPSGGLIHTRKHTIVDCDVAVEARKLASAKTLSRDTHIRPLYRTIIELMANTKKHARGSWVRDETWWLIVYNDPVSKITSFSFIDTGIGIFKSAKVKKLFKFAQLFGIKNNIDVLTSILEGKNMSSTGLPYRGHGLPKIYTDYKNGFITKLHIIANDVYANFDNAIFVKNGEPLSGTFFYWEILPEQQIYNGKGT